MYGPGWKEQTVDPETPAPDYMQHLVILCELDEISPENMETGINQSVSVNRCLSLQSESQRIDKRFMSYATQMFEEIQRLLQGNPTGKVLVQVVIPGNGEKQLLGGLSGLLKTARLENPKLIGQLIEVDSGHDISDTGVRAFIAEIIAKLKENRRSPMDTHIRYQDGKRWVARWSELEPSPAGRIPWKDGGIYLITGGAGGLGLIFADEIAGKSRMPTVILTGRSPLSAKKQAQA